MNKRAGTLIVILSILVILTVVANIFYFYKLYKEKSAENNTLDALNNNIIGSNNNAYLGLWKATESALYDSSLNSFETSSPISNTYFEYRSQDACTEWDNSEFMQSGIESPRCTKYEKYIVNGDIIIKGEIVEGINYDRKRWKMINSTKMEIIVEDPGIGKNYVPFIKYILVKIS